LKRPEKGPVRGSGLTESKCWASPAELFQYTLSHNRVEVFKVLGCSGAKLDLVHLPFQTPTASHFGRGNILALFLRLLKIPQKAFPNLGPQSKTHVGVSENLAQFLLHHFADNRLELFN
jgi:hypothetical protein